MSKVNRKIVRDDIIASSQQEVINPLILTIEDGSFVIGEEVGDRSLGDGNHLITIGFGAGKNSTGEHNIFIGDNAGRENQSDENIFIGNNAGLITTSTEYSVIIGSDANANKSSSSGECVVVGFRSGYQSEINYGTAIGSLALTTSYTERSDFIGYGTGKETDNYEVYSTVVCGSRAGTSLGGSEEETPYSNVLIGYASGTGMTLGRNNTLIGTRVAQSITTGERNTIIGQPTEDEEEEVRAGETIETGNGNVLIGTGIDVPSASSDAYLIIGNRNITSTDLIYATMSTSGSESCTMTINGTTIPSYLRLNNTQPSSPQNGDIYRSNGQIVARLGGTWYTVAGV